jgi:hypothetical protein
MEKIYLNNPGVSKSTKLPTFVTETEEETNDSPICISNLPQFYTTQQQREVMNVAMKKAEDIAKLYKS